MANSQNSFQLKTINWLIKVIGKIRINLVSAMNELRFLKYEMEFGEHDDDIYVVTYLKSGTTLMQMLIYQLTTDGSMDFDHIYEVSPWLRNAAFEDSGVPSDLPSPRIIKTHDTYDSYHKGKKGRFIYIMRDSADMVVSLLHHKRNYNDPDLQMDNLFKDTFIKEGDLNWFTYQWKWLSNKNGHNILYLRYEDLLNDFDTSVQKIIKFLNLKVSNEVIARAKERSSFAFMKEHETKFGEQPRRKRIYNQFIRKGKPGEGKEVLNQEQQQGLQATYNKLLKEFEGKFS